MYIKVTVPWNVTASHHHRRVHLTCSGSVRVFSKILYMKINNFGFFAGTSSQGDLMLCGHIEGTVRVYFVFSYSFLDENISMDSLDPVVLVVVEGFCFLVLFFLGKLFKFEWFTVFLWLVMMLNESVVVNQTKEYVRFLFDKRDVEVVGEPFYFEHHLLVVNDFALRLVEKYKGDREVVSLGALLHDLGILYSDLPSEHDAKGLEAVGAYLSNLNLSSEKIGAVLGCVRAHGCKEVMPGTVEEKIVATSDGLSHLLTPWYLIKSRYSDKSIEDFFKWGLSKVVRDYDKIQFEEERLKAKPYFEMWRGIFSLER